MINKSANLLHWWSTREAQLPMLQRVAQKYLNSNATRTPSERLLTFGGMVVSKKRKSLKSKKVDMLTWLAYNLRTVPEY